MSDCPDTSSAPIINCDSVSLYRDGRTVASGLNFQVFSGDYLGIVGNNETAISALSEALLGQLRPQNGTLTIRTGSGKRRQFDGIGYLPRVSGMQQRSGATVRETVLSGLLGRRGFWPFFTKDDRVQAALMMERLRVDDLADRSFADLSGGQQQSVLLARCLLAAHSLLILDEPTTGLDPAASDSFYDTIRDFNREDGLTILLISQDCRRVCSESTKLLSLSGEGCFFGDTADACLSPDGTRLLLPSQSR